MTDDDVLELLYPRIRWRQPIEIRRTDGAHGLGCRFCICHHGLHARDIPSLFQTTDEFAAHLAQFHPKTAAA